MQQYSPKNQAYLLSQCPHATDVRSFKAWKAQGRSVIKGEKALRVWIPKTGKAIPADLSTMSEQEMRQHFVRGPVFDISQTKPCAPRHAKGASSARVEDELNTMYNAFPAFEQAIANGDIPEDFDFQVWYELSHYSQPASAPAPAEDATDQWLTSVINRTDGNAGAYA